MNKNIINNKSGGLKIGVGIDILRSDGRIHPAVVSSINAELNIITVEWFERGVAKGKEVEFQEVFQINPLLAPTIKKNEITQVNVKSISIKEDTDLDLNNVEKKVEIKKRPTSRSQRRLTCVGEIEKIRVKREERRVSLFQSLNNDVDLTNPNFDYFRMINEYRNNNKIGKPAYTEEACSKRIMVCVRTRPMNKKELLKNDIDIITITTNNTIVVHEPKLKVDLTKYIENQNFKFDYVFDENCDNDLVYNYSTKRLVENIFEGGMATCFAYGQTGSGKTYTMCGEYLGSNNGNNDVEGIYSLAVKDIFNLKNNKYSKDDLYVEVSFYEIYGGKIFDLLNDRQKLAILEDNKSQIQLVGLKCLPVECVEDVLDHLKIGSYIRSKGQTSKNEKSSRSHAVFQLILKNNKTKKMKGKLSLIDLAGNERGADTISSNRDIRFEGGEINKSLLVLKECIRALGRKGAHLPFRGSKLTLVLRDSFIGDQSRICMIASVTPNMSSCENTLNSLRYADRVKELCVEEIGEQESEYLEQSQSDKFALSQIGGLSNGVILGHEKLIKEYFPICISKHSQIFNKTKKVDYNIEDYSKNLEDIINADIKALTNLQKTLRPLIEIQKNKNSQEINNIESL